MDVSSSASRRVRRAVLYMLLPVITVFVYSIYWAFYERTSAEWDETIRLWDRRNLRVHRFSSERVYHGGHGFGWGGGHPWTELTFDLEGTKYHWEGEYIPIAVQVDQSVVYLVMYDRETIPSGRFRLYRSSRSSTWTEIRVDEFPKHLAIQNMWLRENWGKRSDGTVVNEYQVVAEMDPGSSDFRFSLMARLWRYLVNPGPDPWEEPSEAFLRQYKEKWMRPSARDPLNGFEPK